MIESQLLESLSDEGIDAALVHWTAANDAIRQALVIGRDLALRAGDLDTATLVSISRAIAGGPRQVVEIASLVAKVLIVRYPSAEWLVDDLAHSPRTQGRLGALLCLTPAVSQELTTVVLKLLISDRSKKVREMTVDWICRNNGKSYLPMLEAALSIETDNILKVYIAREISLLDKGFHVNRERGTFYVTIQTSGGRVGRNFSPAAADKLSDRQIAERFASELR